MDVSASSGEAFQEEVLGHVGKLLQTDGVVVGSSSENGGDTWEFIISVPRKSGAGTIDRLEKLTTG